MSWESGGQIESIQISNKKKPSQFGANRVQIRHSLFDRTGFLIDLASTARPNSRPNVTALTLNTKTPNANQYHFPTRNPIVQKTNCRSNPINVLPKFGFRPLWEFGNQVAFSTPGSNLEASYQSIFFRVASILAASLTEYSTGGANLRFEQPAIEKLRQRSISPRHRPRCLAQGFGRVFPATQWWSRRVFPRTKQ